MLNLSSKNSGELPEHHDILTLLDDQTIHNRYRIPREISRILHSGKISKHHTVIIIGSTCDPSGETQNHIQIQGQIDNISNSRLNPEYNNTV